MLKNLSVLRKLLLVMVGALAGMAVLGGFALFTLKTSMLDERMIKTRHVVESVYGVLEHFHALQASGKLGEKEAREGARNAIKALRYEKSEYFWINDLATRMIMHPIKPELDGKDLHDMKDPTGKAIFVEFVAVAQRSGSGFVSYLWPKPGAAEPVAKISYVKKFEPWGWVIGSGVYIDDINAAFYRSAVKVAAIILALSVVIGTFIYLVARAITRPLARGVAAAQGIAEGDLGVDIPVEGSDEIGQMMEALCAMQNKLRHIIGDIREIVGAAVEGDFGRRIKLDGHQGFARELAENLNRLNEITHVGLSDVMRVAKACAAGDLSQQISREYPGVFGQTSAGINAIVAALTEIVAEIHAIVEAAGQGNFSERMELAGKQGYTRSLSEQINQLCDITEEGLKDILRVAKALAVSDLTQSIAKEYPGLFGEARNGMNTTTEHLRTLVAEIKEAVDAIHSAAGEIANGNLDLSKRTEEQAHSLDRTAENVAQLTEHVKLNAEHAVQANQLSVSASKVATLGGAAVRESVTTMEAIHRSSQKIAEIIGVIDGIAFQTNILALNAAVEAARAGEQGRGFAVVAGEVRALAQRSASAAREIKELIGASVASVESGTAQVNQAGGEMDNIVASIERVTQIVQEISAASAEQSAGIEQVNQAVAQMDNVTQQNAALVEQAAAAAAALEDQSSQLAAAVAAFRLESGKPLLG